MTTKDKILLVDDDPNIRRLLTFQLTQAGYHVSLANNGLEALRLIRTDPPDLLLLDLFMPSMSGLDVLEKLNEARPLIPVILMSAAELPLAQQAVLIASPANFIAKPFLFTDLLSKIERLLSGE